MSAELGVSRTPLREAVQVLQQEGVLERQEDGTILVKQCSKKEILEVYEARLALEPFCTRQAAQRATAEQCRFLRECCRKESALIGQMESGEIPVEDFACCRYLLMMEVETPFHQMISEAAENHLISKIMQQLRLLSRSWVMIPLPERKIPEEMIANLKRVALEHERIMRAIEERDETEAYESARFHVQNALEIVLNKMEQQKVVESMEQKLSRIRQSLQ